MALPERLRGVLSSFIEDLKARETILAAGLFGSWSRGDAVQSSDVDLLVVENRDYDYEYVERIEVNGCLLDLNYVSRQWINKIPTEVDQKVYEVQVLFDRDGTLTRAKNLMSRVYWRPERIDIRTESYLVEADSYLSRARLAFNRGDYRSVKVNSIRGFRAVSKILIEIGRKPVLTSSFTRKLEVACKSLGLQDFYNNYIELAEFSGLSKSDVKSMLNSLSSAWAGMIEFISTTLPLYKGLHPKVGAKLNYYGREQFLRGLIARTSDLIEDSAIEAANYMFHTLMDALEGYAYLVSLVEGIKFDYALIIRCLSESKKHPSKVYYESINVLGVEDVSSQEAEEALKEATDAALNIRQKRKELIAQL